MLVVRELLLGPKRFSALRAGLPGASADIVTVRLRELVEHGVVRRRQLPPPASSWAYELTEWGAELAPVVTALARWSLRSAELAERADRPLSVNSAVLALRALFEPAAGAGVSARLALRIDGQDFAATIEDGELDVRRAEPPTAGPALTTDPATLVGLLRGTLELATERRAGRVTTTGEVEEAQAFLHLFESGRRTAGR